MELSTGPSTGANTGPPVGRDGGGGDAAAAVEKSWVLSSITQEAWNAVAKGTYDSDTATGETMCTYLCPCSMSDFRFVYCCIRQCSM